MNEFDMEKYLNYLRLFDRQSCPEPHYIAWKILVLKTSEYKIEKILHSLEYSMKEFLRTSL
jgi:hypothetical protein